MSKAILVTLWDQPALTVGSVRAGGDKSVAVEPTKFDARFPTTHWSEVARAATIDPHVKRAALGRLLTAYLPALRAHLVRHKRLSADVVDDLLQGFVCDQVVADDLLARADRERGRLRGFVLVALDRWVARIRRGDNAAKRRPSRSMIAFGDDPDAPCSATAAREVNEFDVAWAREVVHRAIAEMQSQCGDSGANKDKQRVWRVFELAALAPLLEGAEPPSHAALVEQLGFDSPQQASNTFVTAKRMFARVLRSVIGEYAADADQVEEELQDLWTILSRAGATGDRRVSGRDPQ